MHDEAFADATRQAPRRILRVPLLPFSIGHELTLQRFRNPLLFSKTDFDSLPSLDQRTAVIHAVLICSRTWVQQDRREKWMRLWGWLIRKEDFALAVADFRNYRDEGAWCPAVLPIDDNPGRPLGSPFLARVLAFASLRFGQGAFDAPLGMLYGMYFGQAEADGCCLVEGEQEKQIAEMTAEIKRERGIE